MNHLIATYVDFIQSVGFLSVSSLVIFTLEKLILDDNKDNYIDLLKIIDY